MVFRTGSAARSGAGTMDRWKNELMKRLTDKITCSVVQCIHFTCALFVVVKGEEKSSSNRVTRVYVCVTRWTCELCKM